MGHFNYIAICILLMGCYKSNQINQYDNIPTNQLVDTNKYLFNKYKQSKTDADFKNALSVSNLLIKRDSTNLDYYLNKLNLLSLGGLDNKAIAFCDTVFSKFKIDTVNAITILLAKGSLQDKTSSNNAKITYLQADGLAKYDTKMRKGVFSIGQYITYVTTGALAYNKDTVKSRINKYKIAFPSDTATINTLMQIVPQK